MITLSNIYHKVVLGVGAVIAMLTVASCSEFLETPSKSKLSTENFYDNPPISTRISSASMAH